MTGTGQTGNAQAYHDPVYTACDYILCHYCYHLRLTQRLHNDF